MMLIVFLLLVDPQTSGMWQLRSGAEPSGEVFLMGSSLYARANSYQSLQWSETDLVSGIDGGDASLVLPLTSSLVSSGRTDVAEIYWSLEGLELPATRNDLLDALAWFGRFELYAEMAENPSVPADMQGSMHSDQCGAVCALGWMATREDGLFHGEDMVSRRDILLLARFFPAVDTTLNYLPTSSLEQIFGELSGAQ